MDKRAQVVKYMIALIIAVIVVWVMITIFTQQTTKSTKGLTEVAEQAKADNCVSLIHPGRKCLDSRPSSGYREALGQFDDCKSPKVCYEPI